MSQELTVHLVYDPETNTFDALQPEITLSSPEDWVSWRFDSNAQPPAESALLIHFNEPFGPFQILRGIGTQSILATGNKGDSSPTSYTYFLYLFLDPSTLSNLIKAGPFTVINDSSNTNTSPWSHITFNNGQVGIDPESQPLLLHEGDISLVTFAEELDGQIVAFSFPAFGSSTEGPFLTSFITRRNGQGTARLGGATFGSSQIGPIAFGIRVWDADGILVSHHDPTIDGLGRPPD